MKKVKDQASNIWNRLKLYCADCKDEEGNSVEMDLVDNAEKMKEPYFICPCEGCVYNNYVQRITLLDFEKMSDQVGETMANMQGGDITNLRFKIKRSEPQRDLDVKVIYTGRRIGLEIK